MRVTITFEFRRLLSHSLVEACNGYVMIIELAPVGIAGFCCGQRPWTYLIDICWVFRKWKIASSISRGFSDLSNRSIRRVDSPVSVRTAVIIHCLEFRIVNFMLTQTNDLSFPNCFWSGLDSIISAEKISNSPRESG